MKMSTNMKMSKNMNSCKLELCMKCQAYFVFEDARADSGIDQSLCMNDM